MKDISKKLLLYALFLLLFGSPLRGQEIQVREGLPNFYSKVEAKETVHVSYFGGSITAQPGWRVQSLSYLRKRFPNTDFREQDATIGGTGSELGVLRMDYDVLRVKSDLIFVEFAVNDSYSEEKNICDSMEGIVRKIWKQYPDCDICFVYTFNERLLPELLSGKTNSSVRAMETVADKYQIPSIHMGLEALDLLKQGKLVLKPQEGVLVKVSGEALDVSFEPIAEEDGKIYFSPDGTHPYLNTGHVLYTRTLIKGLEECEKRPNKRKNHSLETPLSATNGEHSTSVYMDQLPLGDKWQKMEKGASLYDAFSNRFKSLWKGDADAVVSVRFKGSSLVTYDLIGPGGCLLEVTVDGVKKEIERFDGYCTYWRIASTVLAEGLDPQKEHQAFIRVKELKGKKAILFEQNRKYMEESPAKFNSHEWYVGALFIEGEGGRYIPVTMSDENPADKPWMTTGGVKNEEWHGFKVYTFNIDKFTIQIAEPKTPLKGKPWIMSIGEMGDGFHWQMNEKLLNSGAYIVAINSYNVYGADYGLNLMDSLYNIVRHNFDLPEKCGLYGVSRAGLSVYRWAIRYPERVACMYCEGPVLDFKTWPMAWPPSAENWTELKRYYGFASDSLAVAYKGNPIDNLRPIAKAKIPIRHVISLTDEHDTKIVPNDKNTLKAQQYLQQMGHDMHIVITPEGMKVPYTFDDESIEFMISNATP